LRHHFVITEGDGRVNRGAVARVPLFWQLRGRLSPEARGRVRRVADLGLAGLVGSVRGARTNDAVAITFDDGPDPHVTPRLLDLLAVRGARATFFVLLDRAAAHPRLVRRIVADGHEVALHGPDHRRLPSLPPRHLAARLRAAREQLEQVSGAPVQWFRPPFGAQTLPTYLAVRRAGLRVVVWSADARDWVDRPPARVAADALAALHPGAILLFHDTLAPDPDRSSAVTTFDRVAACASILGGVTARGWRAASVGELVTSARPVRTAWFRP
jgi:peptidoglycan/xylan/chitin deacetylase (PgdA/CDA1 family)